MVAEKARVAEPAATNAATGPDKVETESKTRATDAPESKEAAHENA